MRVARITFEIDEGYLGIAQDKVDGLISMFPVHTNITVKRTWINTDADYPDMLRYEIAIHVPEQADGGEE